MTMWLNDKIRLWWPVGAKLVLAVVACFGFARIGRASAEHLMPPLPASPASSFVDVKPPQVSEAVSAYVDTAGSQPRPSCSASPSESMTADGRLVLNRATEDDLVKLPGIGRKRAKAILRLRSRLRRFRTLRQLLRVRGLGHRMLKRLKPRVVIDGPPPSPPASAAPK